MQNDGMTLAANVANQLFLNETKMMCALSCILSDHFFMDALFEKLILYKKLGIKAIRNIHLLRK